MRTPALTALRPAAVVALLAVLLWQLYGPGDIGFDAAFSVVWGDELLHLDSPDYDAQVGPTPHPLANLMGAAASLAGDSAFDVLIALSYLSLAGLGVAAYVAGRRSFGAVAGVAFAAILLTRPLLVGETLQASIDIPFLALVVAALALELGKPRRGAPVLLVLGLAGLLRPEAWLFAFAYGAYLIASANDRRGAARVAALALAAPLVWLLTDLVTTGDPLFSLTRTQDLAERLRRERGLDSAVRDAPTHLRVILGPTVAWLGLAAGAVATAVAERRARLPLALLVLGLLTFLALGVAELPLLTRYMLVPGAVLALFCAAAVGSVQWLPRRGVGVAASVAAAAVLLAGAPGARRDLDLTAEQSRDRRAIQTALFEVARTARDGDLTKRCRPLQAAVYRPVPLIAQRLGVRPSEIQVTRPFRARDGLMFAAALEAVSGDVGLYPGVVIPAEQLELPPEFRRVASNRWWTLGARC